MSVPRYQMPAGDSAIYLFSLSESDGALTDLSAYTVTLMVRNDQGAIAYSATGTLDSSTVSRLAITPGAIGTVGLYAASIRAVSATCAYTYSFELEVTGHA